VGKEVFKNESVCVCLRLIDVAFITSFEIIIALLEVLFAPTKTSLGPGFECQTSRQEPEDNFFTAYHLYALLNCREGSQCGDHARVAPLRMGFSQATKQKRNGLRATTWVQKGRIY